MNILNIFENFEKKIDNFEIFWKNFEII